ncbi:FAD:protein FMN transferase [Shewanella maritima]|uniref:FAD:protein FMN transferase n=1 Tax=Shewanella maritima TaxID=2520507 RepID=UPI003736B887
MGNDYIVTWVDKRNSTELNKQLKQKIDTALEELNQSMSVWREDSEISLINKAQKGTYPISEQMRLVLSESIRINQLTHGRFDITVTPLIDLWGFGPHSSKRQQPTQAQIEQAISRIGMEKFSLNNQLLIKKNSELSINLSAIAKGYGVDVIANTLKNNNIHNFIVDIGGEVTTSGNKLGEPWVVAVEKPYAVGATSVIKLELNNLAIATSGDYRNYFTQNGQRFSHIIDPKTGYPANNNIVSTTVIADLCMTADALATAFMILPIKESLQLAEIEHIPLMIIEEQFGELMTYQSSAFKQLQQ